MNTPFITIVVPTLNEQDCIIPTLDELTSSARSFDYEIIVADGGSKDDTRRLVEEYADGVNSRVRLIDNPKKIQAAGINLAADVADNRSTILLRADAHCFYPPDFVPKVVAALVCNAAQSVVVPMFTVGDEGTYQQAVALAQNSKLGNGGSAHRAGGTPSGIVDHGHHAAFDLKFFKSIGGYDESFKTNEDAEYDARVLKAGGKIWMAREAEINYYPRRTPIDLAWQYFGYGRGRCATMLKHRMRPRPRQMAPLVIFATIAASFSSLILCGYSILPIIGYLLLCFGYAMKISGNGSRNGRLSMQVCSAFVIMHNAWGAGFVAGLIGPFRARRKDVIA